MSVLGFYDFSDQLKQDRFLDRFVKGTWKRNDKGEIDVSGSFLMSSHFAGLSLDALRHIKFGKVHGKFIINGQLPENEDWNLNFCPYWVAADFDIRSNHLKSLLGGPEKVGGLYICEDNNLTDLKGAPLKYGNAFICERNPLVSFEGFRWNHDGYLTSSQFVLGPDRYECKTEDSELINSLIEGNPDCIEIIYPIFQKEWYKPSQFALGLYKAKERGM
jgi:hypothetical protein